jgi:membrane protease YdiL (CAAX protease family)
MKLANPRRVVEDAAIAPERGRAWELYWAFGLPALLILFQLGPAAPIAAGIPVGLAGILCFTGLADLTILGIAWYVLCVIPGKSIESLGLRLPARKWDIVLLPLAGLLLTILGVAVMNGVYSFLTRGSLPPQQQFLRVLGGVRDPTVRVIAFLVAGLIAPITEEVLFRGVTFRVLRRRIGLIASLFLSSTLFAIAHLDLHHALHLFAIGLVLAWLVSRSDSLLPSILLHSFINGGALLVAG